MKNRNHFVTGCAVLLTVLATLTGCDSYLREAVDTFESDYVPASEHIETSENATENDKIQTDVQRERHAGRYVYTTLDEVHQEVYAEIYATIMEQEESITVSTLDAKVLDEAYRAVMADYGELFWVSGYSYTQYTRGEKIESLEFAPRYTQTREKRTEVQALIDARVEEILAGIRVEASDYEKTRYVFDYLAANVDYVIGAQDNQNIISVFLYGETVCQGYASATQYLLTQLGVQSAIVTGTADGNSHAWNLVRMDGEYYYMDTTWGNSAYDSANTGLERFINYDYFAITTEELLATHLPDDAFLLPECTATEDNYYIREKRYFTLWEPDAIGTLCREGYESGDAVVAVKFATDELYQQTKQYFIEEQHILDYCSGITTLYYVEDAVQRVLIFRF